MTDTTPEGPPKKSRPWCQKTPWGVKKQWVDPVNGRVRTITARTEEELRRRWSRVDDSRTAYRLGDIGAREASQRVRGVALGKVTIDELWNEYTRSAPERSRKIRDATWRHRLAPFFAGRGAVELTQAAMRDWQAQQRRANLAKKTVKNAYDLLAAAFRVAVNDHRLIELPWGAWRPDRPSKRETEERREATRDLEEFASLVLAARDQDEPNWRAGRYADRAYALLVFGLCGLRQGEAAGLGWDHVELEGEPHLMRVHYQVVDGWRDHQPPQGVHAELAALRPLWPPKNGPRSLTMHAAVVQALRAQRAQLQRHGWYRPDGPVFPGKSGKWRTHAEVFKPERFRAIVKKAGLPNVERWTTHSLRHSFATLEVIASAGDLRRVQRRTGHSSIEQLSTYMHSARRGSHLPSAIGELPPALTAGPSLAVPEPPPGAPVAYASLVGATDGALVDLSRSCAAAADEAENTARADRRVKREEKRKRYVTRGVDFDSLARAVVAGELVGDQPPEVTRILEANYQRAYSRKVRAGGTPDEAQAAGKHSRRATRGAWMSALARVRRGSAVVHPVPGVDLDPLPAVPAPRHEVQR